MTDHILRFKIWWNKTILHRDPKSSPLESTCPGCGEATKWCPMCGTSCSRGYGLAGGGMGAYWACNANDLICGYFFKKQDAEDDIPWDAIVAPPKDSIDPKKDPEF